MFSHFLRRVSVRARIVGGFAILLAILALSIPLVFTNHIALTNRVQQLADVKSRSDRLLLQSLSRILSSRVNLMRYADDLLPSSSEALSDVSQANVLIEEVRNLLTLPEQRSATADILAGLVSYNTLITEVQNARNENRLDDVTNLLFNAYRLEFDLEQQIRAVVDDNEARVDAANQTALANARQRLILLIASYLVMLSLFIGIALIVQRSVTQPIAELRQGAEAFRLEHQVTSIPTEGTDELSVLAQTFNQITAELSETLTELEQRVEERTKALATVAEISAAASTILETDKLLQKVVDLSKESFNLYHSHIYLLNEAGDTLVLSSGAGETGRKMVAQERKIPLELEKSLVARAARERRGVIVNDVTQEPDFLPNPLLPDTRSELAVPMIAGEDVIGVFDVQSDLVGRFTDADVNVQTTLASQIASAVQNARLYTQANISRQEAQSLVDYATEAILIVDLETGNFRDPNEAAEKLYGLPHDELVKVGPAQMSPPKQPDGRELDRKSHGKNQRCHAG